MRRGEITELAKLLAPRSFYFISILVLLQYLDRIFVNLKVYTPVMVPDSSLLESSPKGLEYDIYAEI